MNGKRVTTRLPSDTTLPPIDLAKTYGTQCVFAAGTRGIFLPSVPNPNNPDHHRLRRLHRLAPTEHSRAKLETLN